MSSEPNRPSSVWPAVVVLALVLGCICFGLYVAPKETGELLGCLGLLGFGVFMSRRL